MLRLLNLLILQIELMPLVTWIEVVSVDDMMTRSCRRLEHLICLTIIRLKELFKVEVGVVLITLTMCLDCTIRHLQLWKEGMQRVLV